MKSVTRGGALGQPIFDWGKARWYALRVAPQREDQVEDWLGQRDVFAFHPVTMQRMTVRGDVRTYYRRYLPGMVFARFRGDPFPSQVMRCPWITGAITRANNEWGILEPKSLEGLYGMRRINVEAKIAAASKEAAMRKDDQIGRGSRALFRSGPFSGFECEVVDVKTDGGFKVSFQLFGRESLLETKQDDLIKIKN